MGDRLVAGAEAVATRVFGPVFALDAMRVGRRLSTFAARWVYLLVLVSVLVVFFYSWWRDLHAPGGVVHPSVLTRFAESFFWVYTVTQFLAVCALTPAFTAATITDEKERKTLDFLLITDLTGREIVFGKLAVRFGVLFTLVLAGLPVVALMQFFGGIEPRLLFLTAGMTLVSVLSLSAVGMCLSVLLRRTRDAVAAAYGLPAAYVFFSLYFLANVPRASGWHEYAVYFASGNPFYVGSQLDRAFSAGGVPPVAAWYVGVHAAVGVLGFAVAAFRLRSSAEGRGIAGAKPRGAARRLFAWAIGRRTEARPHQPVGDRPVRWREVHVEPGSTSGLIHRLLVLVVLAAVGLPFLGIVYDALVASHSYYRSPWEMFQRQTQAWVCAVTCGLGVIMMLRATVRGAGAVAGERDRDTWVSLITTPLPTHDILHGKWLGCVLGQRDAIALLLAVWAVGVLTGSVAPLSLLLTAVALAAYLAAFAWLGIRSSVTARNTRLAVARALPTAIFLGGGYWFFLGCCCMGVGARGAGEGLAYLSAAVAGITPPAVLGGLPALDSEVFRNASSRSMGFLVTALLSAAAGVAGWLALANAWAESARHSFNVEANRNPSDPEFPRRLARHQLEPWDDDSTDAASPAR